MVAHGVDVACLPIGSRPDMPGAFQKSHSFGTDEVVTVTHDFQHGAYVFGADFPLLAQHVPELLEHTLRLADALLRAFDLDRVAPGDQAHFERIPNQTQELIPAAEKQYGLIA